MVTERYDPDGDIAVAEAEAAAGHERVNAEVNDVPSDEGPEEEAPAVAPIAQQATAEAPTSAPAPVPAEVEAQLRQEIATLQQREAQVEQQRAEAQLDQEARQYQAQLEQQGYTPEQAQQQTDRALEQYRIQRAGDNITRGAQAKMTAALTYAKKYGVDALELMTYNSPKDMEREAKRSQRINILEAKETKRTQAEVPAQTFDNNQPGAARGSSTAMEALANKEEWTDADFKAYERLAGLT